MAKRTITLIISLLFATLAFSLPAQAEEALPQSPLCLPGTPRQSDENCVLLGPEVYLETLQQAGIHLPRRPLPAVMLDPSHSELPYNYVRLVKEDVPIFGSLDDALANQNAYRYIPAGFNFATYVDVYQASAEGARHYMIEPGMWIRGGSTSGRVTGSQFTGLVFAGTPTNKFGWIMAQVESQRLPGFTSPLYTGNILYRYDVVQVYSEEIINDSKWLLIGPDEWIEAKQASLVYPVTTAPEGVTNGRWIEINLLEQTISVYQDNRLVFATLISSGIPGWWTRPGLFQIFEKLEATPMSGAFEADRSDYYYLEDVPWTMYFDEARALHGAYWHNYFGYEQSHGCVNMSPGDSHWLYQWSNLGDFVYVWDPSGVTPTDPALYTAGGA